MKFFLTVLLVWLLQKSVLWAAWDQYGFPANCSMYAACEKQVCVRANLPLSSLILSRKNNDYFLEGNEDRRIKLGYFENYAQAETYIKKNPKPDYFTVIVPNDEIADAFGMNLIPISNWGHNARLSNQMTKISCSAIHRGLN